MEKTPAQSHCASSGTAQGDGNTQVNFGGESQRPDPEQVKRRRMRTRCWALTTAIGLVLPMFLGAGQADLAPVLRFPSYSVRITAPYDPTSPARIKAKIDTTDNRFRAALSD